MNTPLDRWAAKWQVPPQALSELADAMHAAVHRLAPPHPKAKSEADVVDVARLEASRAGWRLFRNNVGAATDAAGNFIRYGLCNESKRQNEAIKSSDLIGIRPIVVHFGMVGQTVGQFVAVECKRPGWTPAKNDKREAAQAKFQAMITAKGGHAFFTSTGAMQ